MALIKAVCTNQTVSVSVSLSLIGQSRLCKQWNVSRLSSPERAWSLLRTVVVWQRWTCGNAGRARWLAVHCLLLPSPPPPLPLGPLPLQALQQCGSVCTALARLPLYSLHVCARISSHCRGSQWVHGIVVKQSPTPPLPWSSFSLFTRSIIELSATASAGAIWILWLVLLLLHVCAWLFVFWLFFSMLSDVWIKARVVKCGVSVPGFGHLLSCARPSVFTPVTRWRRMNSQLQFTALLSSFPFWSYFLRLSLMFAPFFFVCLPGVHNPHFSERSSKMQVFHICASVIYPVLQAWCLWCANWFLRCVIPSYHAS